MDKLQITPENGSYAWLLLQVRRALEHKEVVYWRGNSRQYKNAIKALDMLEECDD